MIMSEIQDLLTTLMREIDKKTAITIEPQQGSGEAAVLVQLTRDKRTGSLQISEADLFAAQTDLMRRNRVRTALKRARDRMWEERREIFSTKVEHQKLEGAQWSRPQGGSRGRR